MYLGSLEIPAVQEADLATVAHFWNLEDVNEKDYFHQRSETPRGYKRS